jgi:hypothetical protein
VVDLLPHSVPVGYHKSCEFPLISEDLLQGKFVSTTYHPVEICEGCHIGETVDILDRLERTQIYISEVSLSNSCRVVVPSSLSCSIAHIMLATCRDCSDVT